MDEFESIDRFYITVSGRTVFTTKLPRDYGYDELFELRGQEVLVDGRKWRVVGIETYAIAPRVWSKGTGIGLAVKEPDIAGP